VIVQARFSNQALVSGIGLWKLAFRSVAAGIRSQDCPEVLVGALIPEGHREITQNKRAKLCRRTTAECVYGVRNICSANLPDAAADILRLRGRVERIKR
jgi:hypothetical protein